MPETSEGPDARFVLANERTFLAYARTALAMLAVGAALLHVDDFLGTKFETRLVGSVVMLVGTVIAIGGYLRWHSNDVRISAGQPLGPTRIPLLLVTALVSIGVITTLLALI